MSIVPSKTINSTFAVLKKSNQQLEMELKIHPIHWDTNRNSMERELGFRYGYYLQNNLCKLKIIDWVVDEEYHIEGTDGEKKKMYEECAQHGKTCSTCELVHVSATKNSHDVRPDIIVHKRGNSGKDANLLYIECKYCDSTKDGVWKKYPEDCSKIHFATCQNGHLHYVVGCLIVLSSSATSSIVYCVNGKFYENIQEAQTAAIMV